MELLFYARELFAELPKQERSKFEALAKKLHIREGRPFFLGDDALPDSDLDGFCAYLLDPQRASSRTWRTYAYQVSVYLRFLRAQGKDWKSATREDLNRFYTVRTSGEFQTADAIQGRSWNIAKSAIVHLYEYALDRELIERLPFKYLQQRARFGGKAMPVPDLAAKATRKPLNFISIADYKTAWRPALANARNAQRDLVLADLLVTTGLRITEALNLQVHQIPDPDSLAYKGFKSVTIAVVGKGAKTRRIRVPKRIVRALRFYMDEDRELDVQKSVAAAAKNSDPPTAVFLSNKGSRLSARTVEGLFQRTSAKTAIKVTPHGCRHTFAIYQLDAMIKRLASNLRELQDKGANAYRQLLNDPLRDLQRLLGHSSITSTYIYLDFLEESEALVDESLDAWTNWENEDDK